MFDEVKIYEDEYPSGPVLIIETNDGGVDRLHPFPYTISLVRAKQLQAALSKNPDFINHFVEEHL